MGRTGSSASSPVRRLLPIAAVPAAAAGLAAALTIGSTSGAPVADDMTGHSAPTAGHEASATASDTALISLTQRAGTAQPIVRLHAARIAAIQPRGKHHRAPSAKYTVKSGDTLASIARHFYASAAYWPVLYRANHATIADASQLRVGQVLIVPAKPAKVPSPPAAATASSGQGATTETTYSGASGSFQACVIAAESGGNPQVMNSSGHYGLYQFSASTWAEYGGNPADFGHASVAEQNQVFENAIAAGGESNWAPYDGC